MALVSMNLLESGHFHPKLVGEIIYEGAFVKVSCRTKVRVTSLGQLSKAEYSGE